MSAKLHAQECQRQLRRLREAIDVGDTEAAMSIIGGRLTDALADLVESLVQLARAEGVTPERCGILLNLPADTIYRAFREAAKG